VIGATAVGRKSPDPASPDPALPIAARAGDEHVTPPLIGEELRLEAELVSPGSANVSRFPKLPRWQAGSWCS